MWMILANHDHRWIQTLTLRPATVGPTGLSILHEKNADMLYRSIQAIHTATGSLAARHLCQICPHSHAELVLEQTHGDV